MSVGFVSLNSSICMALCVYTDPTSQAEVHYGLQGSISSRSKVRPGLAYVG